MRSYSIITEKQFKDNSFGALDQVVEAPTIAPNKFSYNTTMNAVHVNDQDVNAKNPFVLYIGFVKKGDYIKLSAEFMSISGMKPKIAVDYSKLDISSSMSDGNQYSVQSTKTGEFEKVECDVIAKNDGYYAVSFGLFTNDMGEFYMKNCSVKIDTKYSTLKRYKRGFRSYVIKGDNGVYAVQSNFGDDFGTITVDTVNKELILTHDVPFTLKSGIPVLGESANDNSHLYRIGMKSFSATICKFQIRDVATNTLQNPATITGLIWFSTLFNGLDYEV